MSRATDARRCDPLPQEPSSWSWTEWPRRGGQLAVRAGQDLFADNGPQWAAGLAYYALLSAIPLLLVAGSVAAYVVDPHQAIDMATTLLGDFVPQSQGKLEEIVTGAIRHRGRVGIVSFLALLWTGSRVFSALIQALNVVYDVEKRYPFWHRLLIELALLLTVGLVVALALASGVLFDLLQRVVQILPSQRDLAVQVILWLLRALLLGLAFFLIYRFVPRSRQHSRPAAIGAVVATVLFFIVRPLFLSYLDWFGRYNLIYGSLGAVVVILIWVWIVSLITLYGGELAARAEKVHKAAEPRE